MLARAWWIGAAFTRTPARDFLSFQLCAGAGLTLLVPPHLEDPGETKILAGDFLLARAEIRAHFFENACGFLLTRAKIRGI